MQNLNQLRHRVAPLAVSHKISNFMINLLTKFHTVNPEVRYLSSSGHKLTNTLEQPTACHLISTERDRSKEGETDVGMKNARGLQNSSLVAALR